MTLAEVFQSSHLNTHPAPVTKRISGGPGDTAAFHAFWQLPENQDLRFINYWSSLTSSAQGELTPWGIPEITTALSAIEMQIQLSYDE